MSDDEFDDEFDDDFDDLDLDDDFEEEAEEGEDLPSGEPAAEPAAQAAPAEEPTAAPTPVPMGGELVSPDAIPFQVVFEVGRVKMTAQALMNMQVGNVLEVNPDAGTGVNLVINDQVVGRGELVSVGDAIGVRILEKG